MVDLRAGSESGGDRELLEMLDLFETVRYCH
jgi:hypothetical protein